MGQEPISCPTQDLSRFADAHQIPYARQVLKRVKAVIGNWSDYAKLAGVSPETSSRIAEALIQ